MSSNIFTRLFDSLIGRKTGYACPVCRNDRALFLPLPEFYKDSALKYGYQYFGQGEMTALESYSCDSCGASDRERLYAYWIRQQIEKSLLKKNSSIIHFAPEAALSGMLKKMEFTNYATADLMMESVDYQADMMAMTFENESFDFFICSHVLEHVESDDAAIAELHRVTKHGGFGILMAPVIVGLEHTIEDPSVKDEAGRWRMFGQNDHVRLYAHSDYVNKIKQHGFEVDQLGMDYFGQQTFKKLGLKESSILYIARKN